VIASDTLFDSKGGFSETTYNDEDTAEIDGLRDVTKATNLGLKLL